MRLKRPLVVGTVLATGLTVLGVAKDIPFVHTSASAHHSTHTSASPPTTRRAPAAASVPMSTPAPPPTTTPAPQPDLAAAIRVEQAVRASVPDAQVGVEVLDRRSGTVLTSLNSDRQFPTMSVVKLLIALAVLQDNNWALPDSGTQQELTQMLSASDDSIADNLWGQYGGTGLVTQVANLVGLHATEPPSDDPDEWGDTLTTPQDLVTLYQYITGKLPDADRNLLLNAMYNAQHDAADGTDQYFGIPDAFPHSTWDIKQGWGTSGNDADWNTTGLLGADSRYIVVVLTSASASEYSAMPQAVTAGTSALSGLVS